MMEPSQTTNETQTVDTSSQRGQVDNEGKDINHSLNMPSTSTSRQKLCEQMIMENIEDEFDKQLTEKAEKTKLNAFHVKNIIKHVVTNEHVLALVRQTEHPEQLKENIIVYEPKLTRSKTKELLKCNAVVPPVPWINPQTKSSSETHVLVGEDLREDSSGDEYVPGVEESEDEKESSIVGELDSFSLPTPPPLTPAVTEDSSTQTNWTEDGVFKIPLLKAQNDANIALRTRSKINLSNTPLEVIETSFIPPDITTDMYDMECDDENWAEFLKGFMQPIDQITKNTEDEDHDPEYNIMADEISKIDKEELKEELRVDKAVKVSKKELNLLLEELYEFAEMYANREDKSEKSRKQLEENSVDSTFFVDSNIKDSCNYTYILKNQISLVEHQIHQHVQIIAQNFLLTYCHPEFHKFSLQQKEYLFNLKLLGDNKIGSMFRPTNLLPALELINKWEGLMLENSEAVRQHTLHVNNVLAKTLQQKSSGNFTYIPTFSQLVLEVMSKSCVFMYPWLLPKIPYKPASFFSNKSRLFSASEEKLLALGLEQFTILARENKTNILANGEVKLKAVCGLIQEYMMPSKDCLQIYNHILLVKQSRCAQNPIKYYFQRRKAPPVIHYIPGTPPNIAPCQQSPESLPYMWREFIYRNQLDEHQSFASLSTRSNDVSITLCNYKPLKIEIKCDFKPDLVPIRPKKQILPQKCFNEKCRISKINLTPSEETRKFKIEKKLTPLQNFVKSLKKHLSITELTSLYQILEPTGKNNIELKMLPSMPSLQTPVKNCIENESKEDLKIAAIDIVNSNVDNKSDIVLKSDLSDLDKIDNMEYAVNKDNNFANTNKVNFIKSTELRDNLADINALMVASSTVKPVIKKEQTSGAEKKRAKMQKEFMANLAIAKPEDPIEEQKKNERFALAYYDKLRETLELDDYHKIMQIFNDCQSGDAVDLYKKVDQILRPKYEELAEEFLLFLREKEAFAVGRLLPWIQINARSKFLTKVEIYFKDQPAQLKKIYRCLTELSQSDNISMEKIKTTLLPMLKGNKILLDLFFQNCLDERPPSSLLDGPYEIIDFNKEMGRTVDDELFETVTISETKDNYGSFTCICSCHKIEDPEFKSRSRHCIPCGTRFIQGKVYIQTGRGPKPATVSFFPGKCKDSRLMSKSISNVHKKKRSGSPSKHVMHISPPAKENPDDDSDEEIDSRKKSRNKSKKYKKKLDNGFDKANQHNYTVSVSNRSSVYKSNRVTLKDDKKRKRTCSMKDKKVHMLTKVENMELGGETEEVNEQMSGRKCHQNVPECDLNGSGESTEKPTSSGAQTADSESEFCEESSQDNCESDSYSTESTVSNMNSQSDSNVEEWKKEEDRIILETFQRENDKEHAFKLISKKLVNRTIREIRNRFSTLMTLLLEQIGRN